MYYCYNILCCFSHVFYLPYTFKCHVGNTNKL